MDALLVLIIMISFIMVIPLTVAALALIENLKELQKERNHGNTQETDDHPL